MTIGRRFSALLFYVAVSGAAIAGTILAAMASGKNPDPAWAWLLKCILLLILVGGLTWACMRYSGVRWSRYGVYTRWSLLGPISTGLVGGVALGCAWVAIVWIWSPFQLTSNPDFSWKGFGLAAVATVAIRVAEEVGYRTYGLERLESAFRPTLALMLSSLVFVVMHMTGGMPWLAAVCVVGSCSLVYGALMLATRNLPFVAAFHIANNFVQDAVLRTGQGSLFRPSFNGPDDPSSVAKDIWLCMLALNLVVAFCAWSRRRAVVSDGSPA